MSGWMHLFKAFWWFSDILATQHYDPWYFNARHWTTKISRYPDILPPRRVATQTFGRPDILPPQTFCHQTFLHPEILPPRRKVGWCRTTRSCRHKALPSRLAHYPTPQTAWSLAWDKLPDQSWGAVQCAPYCPQFYRGHSLKYRLQNRGHFQAK